MTDSRDRSVVASTPSLLDRWATWHWIRTDCHHGLGRLYLRTGKRGQAQEHLTTATTMYREMGMTYWLEKAEAEMKALA